jgi:dihydrofolate synthase/folylpolyglutamate synthase
MDAYAECLQTMYGLRRFGIKLGLATIKNIMRGLGNPHNSFKSIHVAGTNGKGSVASTLASILHAAGYKVGLYTSPHLVHFNERIRINNHQISNREVVAAYKAVKKVHCGNREPTFFEFATAMGLYEFGRQKVDWAVIETGMGGRLDATNSISPELAIITNISLEHRDYLGNTLSQIAREKSGIIKQRKPVITGVKQPSARAVVAEVSDKKSAPLYVFGKDFRVKRHKTDGFSYYGIDNAWHNLQPVLPGDHQIDNTALVLAAVEMLIREKAAITTQHIHTGISNTRWPGRLQVVSTKPLIILDGAHNLIAARNLGRYLVKNLKNRKLTMVIGILDDKPYVSMLKSLLQTCDRVVLTRARINRALEPEKLYPIAKAMVANTTMIADVEEAVIHAVESTGPDDALCIAGSLYVVGEAMQALGSRFKALGS